MAQEISDNILLPPCLLNVGTGGSSHVLRKKREEAVWAEALCQALRTIVGVSGSTLTLATLAALAQ